MKSIGSVQVNLETVTKEFVSLRIRSHRRLSRVTQRTSCNGDPKTKRLVWVARLLTDHQAFLMTSMLCFFMIGIIRIHIVKLILFESVLEMEEQIVQNGQNGHMRERERCLRCQPCNFANQENHQKFPR